MMCNFIIYITVCLTQLSLPFSFPPVWTLTTARNYQDAVVFLSRQKKVTSNFVSEFNSMTI